MAQPASHSPIILIHYHHMKQAIKQKISALMQRFSRIQKENEALKKQADDVFENAIKQSEKKQIDDIHHTIDSL